MAKSVVYRSFEVREGFGPDEVGPLRFRSETRFDADRALDQLSLEGASAQLFGIRAEDTAEDGERVLLRTLVGRRAA